MGLLADYMKKSLKELGRGFAGELTMSDGMEKLEKSLYLGMCVCFLCTLSCFSLWNYYFQNYYFFASSLCYSTIKNYLLHVNLTYIYIYIQLVQWYSLFVLFFLLLSF